MCICTQVDVREKAIKIPMAVQIIIYIYFKKSRITLSYLFCNYFDLSQMPKSGQFNLSRILIQQQCPVFLHYHFLKESLKRSVFDTAYFCI